MEQREDIEYIEPNFVVYANAIPNDPHFIHQWGLRTPSTFGGQPGADIGAVEAWDITTGSSDVVIAVIDSGVDYTHEDLAANIFANSADCDDDGVDDDGNGYADDCHGIDTVNDDSDPMDDQDHGTHVAGTIGAVGNNGIGSVGVAWSVRILPCKFLNYEGMGTTADAIECFDYIAALKDRGVNIVASNNSWGGSDLSQALRDAIVAQRQRNILVVAAAGNDFTDVDQEPHYPCGADVSNVICVGASSLDDSIAIRTNWGARTLSVQAPGTVIWSTTPGNTYRVFDGTSMATPHVSGVVALLAAQNPGRDWRAIKNLIVSSADAYVGDYPQYNAPHLNAAAALTCTNATVRKRLKPKAFEPLIRPVGAQVVIAARNITCSEPAGAMNVQVAPSGEVVSLRDDGLGEDEAGGDGVYTGTWTTVSVGEFTLTLDGVPDDPFTVQVDGQLKPGFPLTMNVSDNDECYYGGGDFGITVGNVVGDAYPEIIAPGKHFGPLYAWTHIGTPLQGWPVYDSCSPSMVGLGELDGDTTDLEIAATVSLRMIHYLPTGIIDTGWPRLQQQGYFPPALADMDGDGRDEVIGYPSRYANGPLIPGLVSPAFGIDGAPAIADLDSDGRPEVVVGSEGRIWAANLDGPLFGFPVVDSSATSTSWWDEAVVGDVDGDGEPEIVISKSPSFQVNRRVDIHSYRGALKRSLPIPSIQMGKPVLADLNGDGIPEIVVNGYREIYAFYGNGALLPGWPVVFPDSEFFLSYPIVGDVLGGGSPNVVVAAASNEYFNSSVSKGRLYVLNTDGTIAPGFPRTIGMSGMTLTPTIADIDLDGRNELLFTSASAPGFRDNLFAYDFTSSPTGPIEWGQYRGGADHRGFYPLGKNLPNHAFLTAHAHGGGTIASSDGRINCGVDCIERYDKGANVVLTATPGVGAQFEEWVGDCAGQGNPCTLSIQRYSAATARFHTPLHAQVTGTGSGTITSSPVGISCPDDCVEAYPGDSVVTLVAAVASGSDFDGWSGACTGFDLECRVLIDGAKNAVAKFVTERRVTVTKTGRGSGTVTSEPNGIDCGSSCAADFAPDSTVKLTVHPAAGSYFVQWSGACSYSGRECTVTTDADRSVTASFEISPVLTVSRAGTGTGTIRSFPDEIDCGSKCTMEARSQFDSTSLYPFPDRDSQFEGWTGDCDSILYENCHVRLDRDKFVTGRFIFRPWLSVNWTGAGDHGSVKSSLGGINCGASQFACEARFDPNTQITLTAELNSGGVFLGWSGACAGTSLTCTVTMDAGKAVIAHFGNTVPSAGGSGGSSGGNGGAAGGSSGGGSSGGRIGLESLLALLMVLVLRVCRREIKVSERQTLIQAVLN